MDIELQKGELALPAFSSFRALPSVADWVRPTHAGRVDLFTQMLISSGNSQTHPDILGHPPSSQADT